MTEQVRTRTLHATATMTSAQELADVERAAMKGLFYQAAAEGVELDVTTLRVRIARVSGVIGGERRALVMASAQVS